MRNVNEELKEGQIIKSEFDGLVLTVWTVTKKQYFLEFDEDSDDGKVHRIYPLDKNIRDEFYEQED